MNVRSPRFPLVDSLRALAALSIFAYHICFHLDVASGPVARELNIGVPVFFVISGFLLYRPFAAARLAGDTPPALGRYARRRLERIVPAYWVALPLVALMLGLSEVFTPRGVVTYFGFLQIYDADTITGGIGPAWTLCVEVTFYAALPLWAWWMRRASARAELWALAALALASLAYKWGVVHLVPEDTPGWLPAQIALPAFADQFALGMTLAVVSAAGLPERAVAAVDARPWLPWAVAAALFALVCFVLSEGGVDARVLGSHLARGLIGVLVLLPAVVGGEEGGVRRLLAAPALLWLGLVSYGFYLWHLPLLLELIDADLGGWAPIAAAALAAAVAAAAASWYLVERPALRLGRRASEREAVAAG